MYCVLKKEKEGFTTREEGEMKWAMFPLNSTLHEKR